jgi:hypothetical protein
VEVADRAKVVMSRYPKHSASFYAMLQRKKV